MAREASDVLTVLVLAKQAGLVDVAAARSGLAVAPNGTVYGLGIRPLLPDEQR